MSRFKIVFIFLLSLFSLVGCENYKDIYVNVKSIEDIEMVGFTNANVTLLIEVNNSLSKDMEVNNLSGYLYYNNNKFAKVDLIEGVIFEKNSLSQKRVKANLDILDAGVILNIGLNYKQWNMEKLKVDMVVEGKLGGSSKTYKFNNASLNELLKNVKL